MVTGVSITSLCINNAHLDEINIYLIDDGISDANMEKLERLCSTYGRNLILVDATPMREKLIELGVEPWRGTYTTYYKMLAIENVDAPTDLVLQIDGDTVINGPLDELIDFEMGDSICAATYDCVLTEYKTRLGIAREEHYYNCGVMLISRKNWNEHRCTERIINHLLNVRSRYFVVDQDILNVLFRDEMTYFDLTYNFNACFYIYGVDYTFKIYHLEDDIYIPNAHIKKVLSEGPIINHCMSAMTGRPWEHNSIHPQNELFDRYLAKTEWTDDDKLTVRRSFVFRAQRRAYEMLPLPIYWRFHRWVLTFWMRRQDKKCLAD